MSQITAHSIAVDIDNYMLEKLSSTPSKHSMFEVHEDLRSVNPKAYDPDIIAIGPFHHDNEKFQEMEQHKVRYLKLLLQRERERERGNELSVETFVTAIGMLEEEARKCYPEGTMPDRVKFMQMLILDGCFVIEFLRKFTQKVKPEEDDLIFRYGHIQSHVLHDLMVFENQIPFSIIKCLFEMISEEDIKNLISPLLKYGIYRNQYLLLPKEFKIDGQHLLGIVHDMHCPSLSDEDFGDSDEMNIDSDEMNIDSDEMMNIDSAVELEEAGISFKKLKMEDINSAAEHKLCFILNKNSAEAKKLEKKVMFHIEYGNKVMKIPEWEIDDSTESLFRNLIAYEYYLPDTSQRYVSDYVYLMNRLVHSSKDAKLLRRCGIICDLLGSDVMVCDVIYKLGKNVTISANFSYFKIFSQVKGHCIRKWNTDMANLRRKYLNGPWATISVIAAAILLLLTITQTVFAILSFCNDL